MLVSSVKLIFVLNQSSTSQEAQASDVLRRLWDDVDLGHERLGPVILVHLDAIVVDALGHERLHRVDLVHLDAVVIEGLGHRLDAAVVDLERPRLDCSSKSKYSCVKKPRFFSRKLLWA